ELFLALDAVFPAMRPEAPELRIGLEPGQQIIRHRTDRIVSPKALVEGLLPVPHRVLLPAGDSRSVRHVLEEPAPDLLERSAEARAPAGDGAAPAELDVDRAGQAPWVGKRQARALAIEYLPRRAVAAGDELQALHPGRLERLVVEDEPARRVDPAGLPGAGADHPRRRHQRTRVVQAEG